MFLFPQQSLKRKDRGMATLTVNIPNNQVVLIADAFAKAYAMPKNSDGSDPTQSQKTEFARQKVIEFITNTVHQYKLQEAQAAIPPVPDKPVDIT